MNPLALLSSAKGIAIGLAALAIVAAVAGFWISYSSLEAKNRDLAAANATQAQQLDDAARANQQQARAMAALEAARDRDMAAVTADLDRTRAARDRLTKLQRETLNAPASDYVPLSAGARRDLGRLRDSATTPPGQPDSGAGDRTGAAARLPAQPVAAGR